MELIDTTTRHLAGALMHAEPSVIMPVLALIGAVTVGIWLLARRKKTDRA